MGLSLAQHGGGPRGAQLGKKDKTLIASQLIGHMRGGGRGGRGGLREASTHAGRCAQAAGVCAVRAASLRA
eukprot:5869873-Prymnesium_polylepis.1